MSMWLSLYLVKAFHFIGSKNAPMRMQMLRMTGQKNQQVKPEARSPATPKRRPRPWFSSPKTKTKTACEAEAMHGEIYEKVKEASDVLANLNTVAAKNLVNLSNAAGYLMDKFTLADRLSRELTPSRMPAVTSSTSNIRAGMSPLHQHLVAGPAPCSTSSSPSHSSLTTLKSQCQQHPQPAACHSIRRLPCGEMVDGYGHVVTVAQDCDPRSCGGERDLSTPGEDSNIDEAVDNVVRAIYKRAKRDGDLGKKEEEAKKEDDTKAEAGSTGNRKRKLEDAEIS